MKSYYATVQWGVGGYVAGTEVIQGVSMEEIADRINLETDSLLRKVGACLDEHGDLRYWCPKMGEGYPSGTGTLDDDVTVVITSVATDLGQTILDYWSTPFKRLRRLVHGEN